MEPFEMTPEDSDRQTLQRFDFAKTPFNCRRTWCSFQDPFPECVARVPVSLYRGLGVEGVFARRCPTVRNRPQLFATVRNRSREGRMAVLMASSAKEVTFGGFKRRVAFRMAGVAHCDIQTCFTT